MSIESVAARIADIRSTIASLSVQPSVALLNGSAGALRTPSSADFARTLAGNDNEKVRSFGHDRLSVFGIASQDELALVRSTARTLIARDFE